MRDNYPQYAVSEFKKWARENYDGRENTKGFHPVIRNEWKLMKKEIQEQQLQSLLKRGPEMVILKIQLEKDKALELVDNLLTNVIEGGSTYWARCYEVGNKDIKYEGGRYHSLRLLNMGEQEASTEYGIKKVVLSEDKLLEGLNIMANKYPKHFSAAIGENDDAETGDVFLQCCVLGEVVYG